MPDSAPPRCTWPTKPLDIAYHDEEWGVPLHDDRALFELLILEGAQAGLSWSTILAKRENFRSAFQGFDFERVARFGATAHVGGEGIEIVGPPHLGAAVAAIEFGVVAVQPHALAGDHAAQAQAHAAFAFQPRLGRAQLVEQGAAHATGADYADGQFAATQRGSRRRERRR